MKSIALSLIVVFFLGIQGVAFAGDDPKWSELKGLFGKDVDSAEVKKFVGIYNLSKADKGGSGSFSPKHHGYSVMFNRDIVSTIVLQVAPWPKGYGGPHWRPFSGELPSKIKIETKENDLTKMFGKSHTKQGHSWITDGLDIWVHFKKNGSISELYISKEEPSEKMGQNKS